MRPPQLRASFEDDLVADLFAGGGGASSGIARAIGRDPDIAINHCPEAIAVHAANHPGTRHFQSNIWEVDPVIACEGRSVGLLWASPDCKDHSRAKGSKPLRSKKIRALAWVVTRWAKTVRPRVIFCENVEEFEGWGPLVDGRRDPKRAGQTFRAWVRKLRSYGYKVEWRVLVAADYGAPTTRRRLFLVARCDGEPIVWPEPTHGKGRPHPWRPAADVIDWSIPCPSIFGRKKPLAEATLRRIARGIERYVVNAAEPFIVPVTHHGDVRVHAIGEPLRTVTGANRGEFALIAPFVVRHGHYSTITGAGLREGCGAGTFRGQPLNQPLATVCATNDKHIVAALVTKHYGGMVGHEPTRPLGTVTAKDHHALTAAFLTKFYGTSTGAPMVEPMPTVTAGGGKGGGHIGAVRAFLIRYNRGGAPGREAQLPLPTVTSRDRFGLVMVRGEAYQIVDIGMRMLVPHELFGAQGFPPDYEIAPLFQGPKQKRPRPLTKTAQIMLAGNSVVPQVAEAIVRANVGRRRARAA